MSPEWIALCWKPCRISDGNKEGFTTACDIVLPVICIDRKSQCCGAFCQASRKSWIRTPPSRQVPSGSARGPALSQMITREKCYLNRGRVVDRPGGVTSCSLCARARCTCHLLHAGPAVRLRWGASDCTTHATAPRPTTTRCR